MNTLSQSAKSSPFAPILQPLRVLVGTATLGFLALSYAPPAAAQASANPGTGATGGTEEEKNEVITLNPFSVVAHGEVGYGAGVSGSSGRLRVPYIDTPQTTAIVTSELMRDMGLHDSASAMLFIPNAEVSRTSDVQTFTIRGVGTHDVYFDGFYKQSLVFIDTAFTDRVEVVKGPSASAFGRGDPAGFINYVSKRPLFRKRTQVSLSAGTGGTRDTYRGTIDHSGLLGQSGKAAYRFVGLQTRGSTTRLGSEYDRRGAMLAVDYRFKEGADLQVTGHIFEGKSGGSVGNLSFSDATLQHAFRSAIVNSPVVPVLSNDFTFNYAGTGSNADYASLSAVLNYQLTENFNMRHAAFLFDTQRYTRGTAGNVSSVRSGPNGLLVTLVANQALVQRKGWAYQADFLYELETSFLNSKFSLLFGGDVSDDRTMSHSRAALNTGYQNQLYLAFNPDTPISFPSTPLTSVGSEATGIFWSPYVQGQAKFLDGKIQATASFRYTYTDRESRTIATGNVTPIDFRSPLLPTYSLLYKPAKWMSVYVLASEFSERPTIRTTYVIPGGVLLPDSDPRSQLRTVVQPTTALKEIGFKGNFLDNRLSVAASVFRVENTGVGRLALLPDPDFGSLQFNFSSQDKIEGWEIQVHGRPTKRLTMMLGAGNMNSKANIPAPGGAIVNLAYPGNADSISTNLKYSFGTNPRTGLTLIAGTKSFLSGWSANVNSRAELGNLPYPDTVTIANLSARYGFNKGRDSISLRANNAFHNEAVVAGGFLAAVSGRLWTLTYDKEF